jgi:S1-C subfamily serine protease
VARQEVLAALLLTILTVRGAESADSFNPAAIAKKALPAVVSIVKPVDNTILGAGFLVDSSGTVVTNLHVVQGQSAASVRLSNGDLYDDVQVRGFDERRAMSRRLLKVSGGH